MIWRIVCLFLLVMVASASEPPLDRAAYAEAASSVAAHIERGDRTGATTQGHAITARGWRDQGILLPADPAFIGTGYEDPERIAALLTLAAVLTESPRTNSQAPNPAVLDQLRPTQNEAADSEELLLPEVPDSLAGIVDWIQRTTVNALRWLGEILHDVLKWMLPTHTESGGTNITQVVVVLCLVLVTAIASAVAILWWRHRRRLPAPLASHAKTAGSEEAIDRPHSEWERRGELLLAAGDHRGALRAFFHTALAAAFSASKLHHRRGRTNWEYIAQIPARSTLRKDLMSLVMTFERSWYGGHETTTEDCLKFRASVSTFIQMLHESEVEA